jgi:hypothetical protein
MCRGAQLDKQASYSGQWEALHKCRIQRWELTLTFLVGKAYEYWPNRIPWKKSGQAENLICIAATLGGRAAVGMSCRSHLVACYPSLLIPARETEKRQMHVRSGCCFFFKQARAMGVYTAPRDCAADKQFDFVVDLYSWHVKPLPEEEKQSIPTPQSARTGLPMKPTAEESVSVVLREFR